MPLEKIKRPKVAASFVVAAARCATTNALRPFLVPREAAFVAILHVPEGTCGFYKRAAHALIAEPMPIDEAFNELAVVVALYDRAVDASTVFKQYRYGRQIVLVTENLEHVPLETIASADVVREIKPPTPVHYMAAARDVGLRGVTPGIAEFFTEFSFDVLAAVVRGNRPVASVVRHLKRMKVEKAKADAVPVKPKGRGLEDMSGYGEAKTWGLQLAEDLRAWKAGELAWEDIDRGMLLHGPPGTGKTSYAKALANTCDVNLVVASAARWQAAGHLGDFLKAMRSSFAEAKRNAPSILFVDEFDSFGDREGGGDDHHRDYRRQAINGMLECLDPVEGREGVVVVGATNNPTGIDRALLRSGRLEKVIEVPLPDAAARLDILKHHLRDAELKGDVQRFVSASVGWSGADIEKLARDARRLARRAGEVLTVDVLLKAMPARYVLTDSEVRHSAVHEAGHAIVGVVLECDVLDYVRVARDAAIGVSSQSVGTTVFSARRGKIKTASHYDDKLAMFMGGIAAETIVYGGHADGAGGARSSDLSVASDIATMLERHFGFGEALSVNLGRGDRPLEDLRDRDPDLRRLVDARLKAQFERAFEMLSERRVQLDLLAAQLFVRGHVGGDEVRSLCRAGVRNTASVVA